MFDDIRPYDDSEVSEVLSRLLTDGDLADFLARWQLPRTSRYVPGLARLVVGLYLRYALGGAHSIRDFQQRVSSVARKIVTDTTDSFTYKGIEDLDPDRGYIYVSNHRDIAGDSMLLDYALYLSGRDTVRIAVGDNLVQIGFATDLMKLNKSFFIKRSQEGAKKIYAALLQSSQYIHQSLADGHSIWIAQSEGRAKDGMDLTDPAIIKMFALAERKADFGELIGRLNIVPMAISYEYDPCDIAKAEELASMAQRGTYEKPSGADLANLAKGLGGYKGRVELRLGTPIGSGCTSAVEVAAEVDRQIRKNLALFPINYWAAARLNVLPDAAREVEPAGDEAYFESRLAACPDHAREFWLAMYANPVVNKYGRTNQS